MNKAHKYGVKTTWTGNRGTGTRAYDSYDRAHEFTATGKPTLPGSADPSYRGDAKRWNPEELLVASLSACHMLWFLHLCSEAEVIVTGYVDDATGTMMSEGGGAARFTEVVLHPTVTVESGDVALLPSLHERAHDLCFIARSVNFPVRVEAKTG